MKKVSLRLAMLIIVPVIIVIMIFVIVASYRNRHNQPINVIKRAFPKNNYTTIVENYSKLSKKRDKEYVSSRLLKTAEKKYDDYIQGTESYEDVTEYFDLIIGTVFPENSSVGEKKKYIEEYKKAKDTLEEGLALVKKSEYLQAIDSFKKVSGFDMALKTQANEYITECKKEYCKDIINKSEVMLSSRKYEEARVLLADALKIVPGDKALMNQMEVVKEHLNIHVTFRGTTIYNLGDLIAEDLGVGGYSLYFPAEIVFEFTDDILSVYVAKDSIKTAIDELTKDPASMEAIYEVAKNYGIGRTEADILITLTYGGSYSKFIMNNFGGEIDEALAEFSTELKYHATKGKIYLGENLDDESEYLTYQENVDSMLISEFVGDDKMLSLLEYPITVCK